MKKPNFFIIGAPKCGTTSLSRYLAEHPNILFSKIKEPHYFATDFSCPVLVRSTRESEYLDLFVDDGENYLAIGEASTGYFYSKTAVDNMIRFTKSPRFIVILRNPVDMVLSEHAQMLRSGHEEIEDFLKAWNLSESRINGHHLPLKRTENILVSYKEFGRIGTYLKTIVNKVNRENLHIIIHDDMVDDMCLVYKDALKFLNVPYDGRNDFPIYNKRSFHRFKLIKRFVNDPPHSLLYLNNRVKSILGFKKIGFIDWLRNNNLKEQQQTVPDHVLREVREFFDEEIKIVSEIVGRDLAW